MLVSTVVEGQRRWCLGKGVVVGLGRCSCVIVDGSFRAYARQGKLQ